MKSTGLIIIALLQLTSCISYSNSQRNMSNLSGLYTSNIGNERLDLDTDGYYILYNDTNIVVNKECCDIKSKGKWTCIAPNVINLISENYYEKQKGFEYNLIKENRLSQDSLYFHVVFPDVFLKLEEKQCPFILSFGFNYQKSIRTNDTTIALAKSDYITYNFPTIIFNVYALVDDVSIYDARVTFDYIEEAINTEKYNYIIIELPYFDCCFYEFEPIYNSLIQIKEMNKLYWRGKIWTRK